MVIFKWERDQERIVSERPAVYKNHMSFIHQ